MQPTQCGNRIGNWPWQRWPREGTTAAMRDPMLRPARRLLDQSSCPGRPPESPPGRPLFTQQQQQEISSVMQATFPTSELVKWSEIPRSIDMKLRHNPDQSACLPVSKSWEPLTLGGEDSIRPLVGTEASDRDGTFHWRWCSIEGI